MPTIAVCLAYATRRRFFNLCIPITSFQWSNAQVCVSPTSIAILLRDCYKVYVSDGRSDVISRLSSGY
jgi:hypothetical protein